MDKHRRIVKRRIRRSAQKNSSLNYYLLIVFVLAITAFTLYPEKTDVNASAHWNEPVEITVQQGQSLWTIAENIPGSDSIDIRKAIYEIKELNQLDSSSVRAGQVLLVPSSFN